jgi:hypothetical protein
VPLALKPQDLTETARVSRDLETLARLKPGVSVAQAQAAMNTLATAWPQSVAVLNHDSSSCRMRQVHRLPFGIIVGGLVRLAKPRLDFAVIAVKRP